MQFSVLLIILMLFCTASCGKKDKTIHTKQKVSISENQLHAIIRNQIVECESISGGRCPEGIARLLILNKEDQDDSAVCSGFMIGEDRLVTNHHCVSTLDECKNTYVYIFNGTSYEQTTCSDIVVSLNDFKNSNDPRKQIDVSVLKLAKKFSGKPFKPSLRKLLPEEQVTAWVIDHTGIDKKLSNLFESRITEFNCKVRPLNGRRATMLGECPVIKGNSGSPVVNADGEITGVIWGTTAKETLNSSLNLAERRLLKEKAAITEVHHFIQYFSNP